MHCVYLVFVSFFFYISLCLENQSGLKGYLCAEYIVEPSFMHPYIIQIDK